MDGSVEAKGPDLAKTSVEPSALAESSGPVHEGATRCANAPPLVPAR